MSLLFFEFLGLALLEHLTVDLEVELPAEGGFLIQTPDGVCSVCDGVPAFVVESLCLLCAAEDQWQGEFSLIAALGLVNEVHHVVLLVQAPGPEVCAVDELVSYPDFHTHDELEDVCD